MTEARGPNPSLQERLDSLIDAARRNEATLRRFQSLELAVMGSTDLPSLLQLLLREAPPRFEWDMMSLRLTDPQFALQRLLRDARFRISEYPELAFVSDGRALWPVSHEAPAPLLGRYDPTLHQPLFRHAAPSPKSVGLLPLLRGTQWIGVLALGGISPDRFQSDSATDFLQHLAAVIAVSMENAINRQYLKHLGLTDALTGVNNRRYFDQRLAEEVARAKRTQRPLSCLFIDVDHFKRVNDEYGHTAGDEVLRQLAGLIRSQLRSVDVVARYGGEEFVVLAVDTGAQRAAEVAERIRSRIAAATIRLDVEGQEARSVTVTVSVSVSVGVATSDRFPHDADVASEGRNLVSRADDAAYDAKRAGRNRVGFAK